jgi:hypothetical protein
MLGSIPGHQSFPDVIIGEVAVLVVWRIEVREVEVTQLIDEPGCITANGPAGPDEKLRRSQLKRVVGPSRPLLDVRHLQTCCRVNAIRRVYQACQEDGIQGVSSEVSLDTVTDGVDSFAIEWLEIPRLNAEGFGEIPGSPWECVEFVDRFSQVVLIDGAGVCLDVALGEDLRIPGGINGRYMASTPLELLGDSGRPSEKIKGGTRAAEAEHLAKGRHQSSF